MQFNKIFAAAILALAGLASTSATANLVANGSFEEGSSGWSALDMNFSKPSLYAHSGEGLASTGCRGNDCVKNLGEGAYLGQTLNTAANSLYTLSFWVGETGDGPSGFSIFWDGQRVAEKLNPANNTLGPNGSGMVQYLFSDLMAAGALTSFEIHGRQDRAKIYFDDVSVLAVENINSVPEPSSLALIGLGLAGLAFVKRRKA